MCECVGFRGHAWLINKTEQMARMRVRKDIHMSFPISSLCRGYEEWLLKSCEGKGAFGGKLGDEFDER